MRHFKINYITGLGSRVQTFDTTRHVYGPTFSALAIEAERHATNKMSIGRRTPGVLITGVIEYGIK